MSSVPQIDATNQGFLAVLGANDVSLRPVHHRGDRQAASAWSTRGSCFESHGDQKNSGAAARAPHTRERNCTPAGRQPRVY